jgi:hypothetical protein
MLIGVYVMDDVFDAAAKNAEGYITVDFLHGTIVDGNVSPSISQAIAKYRDALPGLCEKHGVPVSAFRELTARYFGGRGLGSRYLVSIEDQAGRRSSDEYVGRPGRRIKVMDSLGRIRTKRK